MALGLGLGIHKERYLKKSVIIANAFENRVLADGGEFYAKSCLVKTINELSNV